MGWMRTNLDFGLPMREFRISCRRLHKLSLRFGWPALHLNDGMADATEALVKDIVLHFRPELSGCMIAAVCYGIGMDWLFLVVHPSLEKAPMFGPDCRQPENLETCRGCRKPLPDRPWHDECGNLWCSKECCSLPQNQRFRGPDPITVYRKGS